MVEEDTRSDELPVDVVISPIEREVLLSDLLIGELGIIILNAYKGLWKLNNNLQENKI